MIRAPGALARTSSIIAAHTGTCAVIAAEMLSTPPVTNLSAHGGASNEAAQHCDASAANPMSLPPIVIVINVVSAVTASICGGTGPSAVSCAWVVMLSVVAPLHVTSINLAGEMRRASTDG